MRHLRVRLPELLAQHHLNRRQLSEAVGIRYATLNDVFGNKRRPSLDTLEAILNGVEQLTGQPVPLSDLVEVMTSPNAGQNLDGVIDLRRALSAVESHLAPEALATWHAAFETPVVSLPLSPPRGVVAVLNVAGPQQPPQLHPAVVLGGARPTPGLLFVLPLAPPEAVDDIYAPQLASRPGGLPVPCVGLPLLARAVPSTVLVHACGQLNPTELNAVQRAMRHLLED